jgi:hypothetical protein
MRGSLASLQVYTRCSFPLLSNWFNLRLPVQFTHQVTGCFRELADYPFQQSGPPYIFKLLLLPADRPNTIAYSTENDIISAIDAHWIPLILTYGTHRASFITTASIIGSDWLSQQKFYTSIGFCIYRTFLCNVRRSFSRIVNAVYTWL